VNGPVAVFNAGSSSLRFSLWEPRPGGEPVVLRRGRSERAGRRRRFRVTGPDGADLVVEEREDRGREFDHGAALERILSWLEGERGLPPPAAAGHRVVHGGRREEGAALLTPGLLAELEALVPLAPLHQLHNLAIVRALGGRLPGLPQVACFDTAFHRTQQPLARLVPLPRELRERGIERYGFHGISYASVAARLPALLGAAAGGRVIVAHLGNGASLCALRDGRSVATTMGFSTLDGLLMGTRCGGLDPGVVLHLVLREGMAPAEVEDLLYHRSGLLGISGVSHDMRVLLASEDPRAAEAVAAFVNRVAREVGALAATLGGLDALVFTAGIGENSAEVRARICESCRWLGLELDAEANGAGGPRVSAPASLVSAWVVPTDEERRIAAETLRLLAAPGGAEPFPRS